MENPRGEETGKAIAEVAAKDPGKGHFYVSIVKSVLRIGGCVVALMTDANSAILVLALTFLLAELLGIVEEVID